MKRAGRIALRSIGALLLLVALFLLTSIHRRPELTAGPAAEALAHDVQRAVGCDAFAELPAIAFAVGGRQHLWDKGRGYAQVRWRGHDVRFAIAEQRGRAFTDGVEITDVAARQQLIARAYAWWANDSFWLNPLCKLFDDGTERAAGMIDGQRALEVHYGKGGVTPGDRYVWILDAAARPERWRLWVKVLPVPGIEMTWEAWRTLGGAQFATMHRGRFGLRAVKIDRLEVGSIAALAPGGDPFALSP